jgi:hypothetical protein
MWFMSLNSPYCQGRYQWSWFQKFSAHLSQVPAVFLPAWLLLWTGFHRGVFIWLQLDLFHLEGPNGSFYRFCFCHSRTVDDYCCFEILLRISLYVSLLYFLTSIPCLHSSNVWGILETKIACNGSSVKKLIVLGQVHSKLPCFSNYYFGVTYSSLLRVFLTVDTPRLQFLVFKRIYLGLF